MAENEGRPAEALGRALHLRRVELGLKRRDLAVRAELSYPYVSELENGQKEPSAKALRQLAEALELTPADLAALADRLGDESDRSSSLLVDDQERPARAPSPAVRAVAQPQERVDAYWLTSAVPTPSAGVASGQTPDGVLERWIREVVTDTVRSELVRWATRELPTLVRAEFERLERGEPG
jgi:transcriptional regulator with XRE-family HTH domain